MYIILKQLQSVKIIIIEGCDNLGKSTLIANLTKYYNQKYNVIIKHSGKPPKSDDPLKTQYNYFINEVDNLIKYKNCIETFETKETLVIYDRFVQGEYVWGSLYRNYSLDDIKNKCVEPVISKLINNIGNDNIISILLDADDYFIYYNDDGLSFSSHANMDDAIELIKRQRKIFNETMTDVIKYSAFNNNIIYNVQNTDSLYSYGDFIFRPENIILKSITDKINEKIGINNDN